MCCEPIGGRRKVGGSQWVQRRLFEQIQDQAPQFVLLRQALSELAQRRRARASPAVLPHLARTSPLVPTFVANLAVRLRLVRPAIHRRDACDPARKCFTVWPAN